MPLPTLEEVLRRFEGLDIQAEVGRGHTDRLVVQISIAADGELPAEAPAAAPAPQDGAFEPAPEPAEQAVDTAILPREVPADFAGLPGEVRRLASRFPSTGALAGGPRLLQAAAAGATDRRVANGDQRFPDVVPRPEGLGTKIYVVLVAEDHSGPWVVRSRAAYHALCGSPLRSHTVSRALASDSEAIACFWGSGLEADTAPTWRS